MAKMPNIPKVNLPKVGMPDLKMGKANVPLIILVSAAVLLNIVTVIFFKVQRASSEGNQREEIQKLEAKWVDEDEARKTAQETELQGKYGTNPLDRIAADPRMNIKLSIEKLFQAVVPQGETYITDVTVDRFTEFRVLIDTGNLPEPMKLAGMMKEVFSRIDPALVYEVIYTDGERFWIINQDQLTSLDWKNSTLEQIIAACFPIARRGK